MLEGSSQHRVGGYSESSMGLADSTRVGEQNPGSAGEIREDCLEVLDMTVSRLNLQG